MACRPVRGRPPSREVRRRNGCFALVIVLWTLVLIAFIVAHITASGRTEIRIAGNLVANAAAEAAADGAIFAAIFNLTEPKSDQRWPIDGTARELAIGNSRVEGAASRTRPGGSIRMGRRPRSSKRCFASPGAIPRAHGGWRPRSANG